MSPAGSFDVGHFANVRIAVVINLCCLRINAFATGAYSRNVFQAKLDKNIWQKRIAVIAVIGTFDT